MIDSALSLYKFIVQDSYSNKPVCTTNFRTVLTAHLLPQLPQYSARLNELGLEISHPEEIHSDYFALRRHLAELSDLHTGEGIYTLFSEVMNLHRPALQQAQEKTEQMARDSVAAHGIGITRNATEAGSNRKFTAIAVNDLIKIYLPGVTIEASFRMKHVDILIGQAMLGELPTDLIGEDVLSLYEPNFQEVYPQVPVGLLNELMDRR